MNPNFVLALIIGLVLGATIVILWFSSRGNFVNTSFGLVVVLLSTLSFRECVR